MSGSKMFCYVQSAIKKLIKYDIKYCQIIPGSYFAIIIPLRGLTLIPMFLPWTYVESLFWWIHSELAALSLERFISCQIFASSTQFWLPCCFVQKLLYGESGIWPHITMMNGPDSCTTCLYVSLLGRMNL